MRNPDEYQAGDYCGSRRPFYLPVRVMAPSLPNSAVPSRRRLRFGLRSLLAAMTAICILLAIVAGPLMEIRRERQLIAKFSALGAKVSVNGSIHRGGLGRALLALIDSHFDESSLCRLDFSGAAIADSDLTGVARLTYIDELKLGGTAITDDGLRNLAGLNYLKQLDLHGTRVTDNGIANLGVLPSLNRLSVADTAVTYAALERLDATLPFAHLCQQKAIDDLMSAGVQIVHLPNYIDREDAQGHTVCDGERVTYVLVGMTSRNRPTATGSPWVTFTADQMAQLNRLGDIESIEFHSVSFGPEGLTGLAAFPSLKAMSVWHANLQDRDLDAIARQTELNELGIHHTEITDQGLATLKRLKKLQRLTIVDCPAVSGDGQRELQLEIAARQQAETDRN